MTLFTARHIKELIEYHNRMARKHQEIGNKRKALLHTLEANLLENKLR